MPLSHHESSDSSPVFGKALGIEVTAITAGDFPGAVGWFNGPPKKIGESCAICATLQETNMASWKITQFSIRDPSSNGWFFH